MKNPELSIIITHYKTPHLLLGCLDSIAKNITKTSCEIFIADSEATTGTAFLIKYHHPKVIHLAFRKNAGYAKLVNEGLKNAQGKHILILNADTVVEDEKSLRAMIEYLENNKDVGIVGPKLLNIDDSVQKSYFKEYTLGAVLARRTIWRRTSWGKKALNEFENKKTYQKESLEVDWLMGSALMTTKKLVDKVGLMDERYFMYFEDVDWCRSFRFVGYKIIYLPKAVIRHFHLKESDSKKGLFDILTNRLTRIHIMSYLKYLAKWKNSKNN
jgi:N-acetylglucosaminyl-diphospho-decaprenol L-rhamnosyltransferase